MSKNIILEGTDLSNLVRTLNRLSRAGRLTTLTVDVRSDGMAYKVNEHMWTPTIGRVRD